MNFIELPCMQRGMQLHLAQTQVPAFGSYEPKDSQAAS